MAYFLLTLPQLAILNAAGVPGRTLPNLLADSMGHFNVIVPVSLICGGIVFAMFHLQSVGPVIAFSIVYGFFSGACKYVQLVVQLLNLICV